MGRRNILVETIGYQHNVVKTQQRNKEQDDHVEQTAAANKTQTQEGNGVFSVYFLASSTTIKCWRSR